MQPFSAEFARTQLTAQTDEIEIAKCCYRAEIENGVGWVRQRGPEGEKRYRIEHAMGGKNVYYFLTPMARGRLQVLPVAYDVRRKAWFDTTASAIRHFLDRTDEALDWRERPLTFNTSCFGCHVSQLSTNYDLKTDTYRTVWAEPGINCETCHGPGGRHVRACREAPEGQAPADLEIIITRDFTHEQANTMCGPCHAKMIPLTTTFQPGNRYFDHYDLVTLEHADFYPDGRDLGENYTYTLWRMSPCVKSGRLDCRHCHTSSGRLRFKPEQTNNACMPCHREHVENPTAHSKHKPDSTGSKCIACHMPMTEFARMVRSDHSMRPPTPAATIRYKSPNACNLCHTDKDAAWSDQWVRKWRKRDYQAPVLHRAGLIAAARKPDWRRLPEMLAYVTGRDRDEVCATSLIRLLRACSDARKWPALLEALKDPSPLVRASAADALGDHRTPAAIAALLAATRDDYRLVRIRSAASLAGVPRSRLGEQGLQDLDRAVAEFEASMRCRPDDAASHYNLGNFYMNRNELAPAVASFETAVKLQPDFVPPLVNASIAYNLLGQNAKAERSLRKALSAEPNSPAANLNLGLLLGEQGRVREAQTALRRTLEVNPNCAVAAYNLGVLLANDRIDEAIGWCRKASTLCPDEPKYAYTLAFYQYKRGDTGGAVDVLRGLVQRFPAYPEAPMLLGQIHEQQGDTEAAVAVYRQALADDRFPERERQHLMARVRALTSR